MSEGNLSINADIKKGREDMKLNIKIKNMSYPEVLSVLCNILEELENSPDMKEYKDEYDNKISKFMWNN